MLAQKNSGDVNASEGGHSANRRISYIILFILIGWRLGDAALIGLLFGSNAPDWILSVYSSATYALSVIVLWLNRNRLQELNIDANFIKIYILSGLLLIFLYLPVSYGVVVGIATALLLWSLITGKLSLGSPPAANFQIIMLMLLALIPALPAYVVIVVSARSVDLSAQAVFSALYYANLPIIVFEEFLFRGLLWKFLRDLRLSDATIVIVQALLFWAAHYQMLESDRTFSFWVTTPFVSLILGIIVLRTRSLTLSTLSHYLVNFLLEIAKTAL
jgi:membrane protease YdiL (CAAX protease family)